MPVDMKIRVDLHNTLKNLNVSADKLKDLRVPLKQSGVYMEGAVGKRFRSAPWKPLSPNTIKRHPRREGGKPLNDTGRLKRSVTSQVVKKVSARKLEYGTNLVYAGVHNFGYKQIPKREFLFFSPQDERAIKRIFEDYIKGLAD